MQGNYLVGYGWSCDVKLPSRVLREILDFARKIHVQGWLERYLAIIMMRHAEWTWAARVS